MRGVGRVVLAVVAGCALAAGARDVPGPSDVAVAAGSLSLEDAAGQVLLGSMVGRTVPTALSMASLRSVRAGGVVLFGHNVGASPAEVARLTGHLRAAARRTGAGIPYLIAVDQEGGRVQRLRRGFTRLPAARTLGRLDADGMARIGRAVGMQLRAAGITMNLAPVVEASRGDEDVIGDRAFAVAPGAAGARAAAFARGMQAAGVVATAKHFPGNAASPVDPHLAMPRLALGRSEVEALLMPGFRAAIAAGVGAVMLAHVEVPSLDDGRPVTVSPAIVTGVLRDTLGFDGVVCTDDLLMAALRARYAPPEAAVLALEAGADLLMVTDPSVLPSMHRAIVTAVREGRLPRARLDAAVGRILRLKARFSAAEVEPWGERAAARLAEGRREAEMVLASLRAR